VKLEDLRIDFQALPGAIPAWRAHIGADRLRPVCEQVRASGGRLLALWGSDERAAGHGFTLHVALATHPGLLVLTLALDASQPAYPDISAIFPQAERMQRAAYDMLGLFAQEAVDHRKWLRHGCWPGGQFPLRKEFDFTQQTSAGLDTYPFIPVIGQGVHEIPVGPVHAGTIEPGHFRFSIVGERILRLEERLGYKHKGIEKLAETMDLTQGARLAGRVSGDSTCAYAWAYAMALENMTGVTPPPRALLLRALLLERERIHNHLGDLGYLGNDVALSFGFAQFWILKEEVLRANGELFGHRYLMDRIIPGGVACDLPPQGKARLLAEAERLEREIGTLRAIYEEHAGVQDRFLTTGRVTPDLAARLGLTGMPGRASGQAWDLRAQYPCAPYDELDVRMVTHRNGDVAARAIVRIEEVLESLRLTRLILDKLPEGPLSVAMPQATAGSFGVGMVESWRGEVLIGLQAGADNRIERMHPHDPSWQNWPLLEHAVIGNIVPDFPLINKSFNLSYTGQDL
jgi:Ni,Fe-hydrogenase III large subunit/Ni,Fe-hydrogenase III component G